MAYVGAQRIYFGKSAQGRVIGGRAYRQTSLIRTSLDPVNPEAFRRLKMPSTNPAAWARRERVALSTLMYAMGGTIKRVLSDVLQNSANSSRYGFDVAPTSPRTAWFRKSNTSTAALRDTGTLLGSLRVQVLSENLRHKIEIDFQGTSRNWTKETPASAVAYYLEFGTSVTVTPGMRKLLTKVAKEKGHSEPWRAAPAVGSWLVTPGRPFFNNSIRAGIDEFTREYLSSSAGGRALFDLYFSETGGQPMARVRLGRRGRGAMYGLSDLAEADEV